eukprot:CAMPEP_0203811874 /NCGR_PEP_ID=MMETSP0115-20131106/3824_1 /ASSEMBLY_ACC=CAM_ASM_000227 /TAXON_ID=33651 /ORGANISM="Bicosoecid sp, Strain ms1" /LENGTH=166 /DNA_ID=CAMNT_0050720711 /DNA_START=316 /DNA_END=813 /DNA_ORIENTATION=+
MDVDRGERAARCAPTDDERRLRRPLACLHACWRAAGGAACGGATTTTTAAATTTMTGICSGGTQGVCARLRRAGVRRARVDVPECVRVAWLVGGERGGRSESDDAPPRFSGGVLQQTDRRTDVACACREGAWRGAAAAARVAAARRVRVRRAACAGVQRSLARSLA